MKTNVSRLIITIFLILSINFLFVPVHAQHTEEVVKLLASDGTANDYFGFSVSVSGDYAIVGAYLDDDNGNGSGSAYIYHNTDGTWEEQVKLTPSNGEEYDSFGYSVSISGDYVIVGAHGDDDNGSQAGSAYIFYNNSGIWQQHAKLLASDGEAYDNFGHSVCVSGNYAIVGAYRDGDNGTDSGSAYIFDNTQGVWEEQVKLIPSDVEESDFFGASVSISDNYALVGNPGDDDNFDNAGSAYIYYNDAGTWQEEIKLTASDATYQEGFGRSTDISDDYAIVGVPAGFNNGTWAGSAYIFQNVSGIWEETKIVPFDGTVGYRFGNSVCISNDYVIAGAWGNDDNADYAGSAYIFNNNTGTWQEEAKLLASDGEEMDVLGWSSSISGDFAIVGAYRDNDNGEKSGSVYIFGLPIPRITSQPENQTDVCVGSNISFSIDGEIIDNYQWQESSDDGVNFTDIVDGGIYSNATTAILTITGVTNEMNNYQYRCYVTNSNSNAISAVATLTIDTEDPVITSTHDDLDFDAGENCEIILPDYTGDVTATDNCDNNLDITQSPTAGIIISGITNTITLTVTDDAGNFAEATFNIAVVDNTNPEITSSPSDQEFNANGNCEAILPDFTGDVTATDYCDNNLDVSQSPMAGTTISGTTNTITLTVTDDAGNFEEAYFNATVIDNTNPEISCIDNITIEIEFGETSYTVQGTEFDPVSVSDNCIIENISNSYNNTGTMAGEEIPVGMYIITWHASDESSNESECSFDITIDEYTGIKTFEESGISIYPNPTNEYVVIDFGDNVIKMLEITELAGKLMLEKTEVEQNETIDLSAFETGVYIVKIQTAREVITTKLVKK